MQSLTQIRELLAAHGLAPKKSLGQNFLIDHNLIRKLVDTVGVTAGDLVLEVGPGTGTLTEELLARGASVIASELDAGLAALLREQFAEQAAAGRFTLIEGDCLHNKHELNHQAAAALGPGPFKLVANLPYGAGTLLLLALLTGHPECGVMAVTVQREVADRLTAGPGSKEYGAISVVAQALCTVKPIAVLGPECFWPRPDVTSSMILLTRRPEPLTADAAGLADAARKIFAQRRKQLGSVLGRGLAWPAGIDPRRRAEELDVRAIVALAAVVSRSGDRNENPSDAKSEETDGAE